MQPPLVYYTSDDGRQVMDGTAGLWCVNAGLGRRSIAEAVERQLMTLDFAPTVQMGHPTAFDFAERLAAVAPGSAGAKLDRVFFTGSRSESVDTALKIALAYQRAKSFEAAKVQAQRQAQAAGSEQEVSSAIACLALEPSLKIKPDTLAGGIHTPSEQVGDCRRFCDDLTMRLRQRNNVAWQLGTHVRGLVVREGRVRAVETSPATPDSRPIVGWSPVPNLFLNAGHGSLGRTLACGSARLAAQLISSEAPGVDPAWFAFGRSSRVA